MTYEDTAKIIKLIMATYESFYRNSDKNATTDRVRAWYDILRDENAAEVAMAVKAYISTDTSGYPPDIGKITDWIYSLHNPDEMTEQEAWNKVLKAACNSAYHAEDEFEKLPPILQNIVGTPNYLRDIARTNADSIQVAASNFMRSYKAKAKAAKEQAKLPNDVKKLIASIASTKSLDRLTEQATPKAIGTQGNVLALETVEQERQLEHAAKLEQKKALIGLQLASVPNKASEGELTDWTEKKQEALEKLNAYKIPTVDKLPADWYDPKEDAEWQNYLDENKK